MGYLVQACKVMGVGAFAADGQTGELSAGYRSSKMYFDTAKTRHLKDTGTPVSCLVTRTMKDVVRSISRGLGGCTSKVTFVLENIPCQNHEEPPLDIASWHEQPQGKPLNPEGM